MCTLNLNLNSETVASRHAFVCVCTCVPHSEIQETVKKRLSLAEHEQAQPAYQTSSVKKNISVII